MQTKQFTATVEKFATSEFDARFVMSAATPDRVRDTIDVKAYESATKLDKLIALFNHDPNQPVGYWTNIKTVGDTLTGYIKFASTNLGMMLKQLIEDGVPMAASIGFRGKGEPNKQGGIHFKEIELLETSIVSTPAHPRAVQLAKQFGIELQSSEDDTNTVKSDRAVEALERAKKVILTVNQNIYRSSK